VLYVQRAGPVPGGGSLRLRHPAWRWHGPAPVRGHRVRARLLAAADAIRAHGRGVQVRLPAGIPDTAGDHAGDVGGAVPAEEWLGAGNEGSEGNEGNEGNVGCEAPAIPFIPLIPFIPRSRMSR